MKIKVIYILILGLVLFSCQSGNKNKKEVQINIENFVSSVYTNMNNSVGIIELKLDEILEKSGLIDGSAQRLAPMIGFSEIYINAIKETIDLNQRLYLIVNDLNIEESLINATLVFKVKSQKKLKDFLSSQGEVKQKNNLNYFDLREFYLIWKNDIAIVIKKNEHDIIFSIMENGFKLDKNEVLIDKLKQNNDITIHCFAKNILKSYENIINKKNINSDGKKIIESIENNVGNTYSEVAINFNKGVVDFSVTNSFSKPLMPLVEISQSKSVDLNVFNEINVDKSIAFGALNINIDTMFSNWTNYIIQNKILDVSLVDRVDLIKGILSGQLGFSLVQESFELFKPLFFLGGNTPAISLLMTFSPINTDDYSTIENDVLIHQNIDLPLKSSVDSIGFNYFQNKPISGLIRLNKIKISIDNQLIKVFFDFFEQLKFRGDFNEITGKLESKNKDKNVLKNILVESVNKVFDK